MNCQPCRGRRRHRGSRLISLAGLMLTTVVMLLALAPGALAVLTACEFYSGMGGFRAALELALAQPHHQPPLHVTAFDINTSANAAYQHAWGDAVVCRSIEHLSGADLQRAACAGGRNADGTTTGATAAAAERRCDLWMMSPPCQPHTRQGHRADLQDPRTKSFMHLLSLLSDADGGGGADGGGDGNAAATSGGGGRGAPPLRLRAPRQLALENVVGFESSEACARLLDTLSRRGYEARQFLLSPTQLGIPNTRTRYYCLATLRAAGDERAGAIHPVSTSFPGVPPDAPPPRTRAIGEFLEELTAEETDAYAVDARVAAAAAAGAPLDAATACSTETLTWTKGYGKQIGKSGSYVLLERATAAAEGGGGGGGGGGALWVPSRRARERFAPLSEELRGGGAALRYFTPREMLRVSGFPETYRFPPPGVSARSAYKLIGNSVSVAVIARLLEWLLRQREEGELECR